MENNENMVANEVQVNEESKVREVSPAEAIVVTAVLIGLYEGAKFIGKKCGTAIKKWRADKKAAKLEKQAEKAVDKVESEKE